MYKIVPKKALTKKNFLQTLVEIILDIIQFFL